MEKLTKSNENSEEGAKLPNEIQPEKSDSYVDYDEVSSYDGFPLGLAMRLRIHAVHADDPHMRICASRCACKNLDADQPHIEQKRVLQRQILQIHVV